MDIKWSNGKLEKVIIRSRNGGNCRLRSLTPLKCVGLKAAKGENPNSLFYVPETGKPLISKDARLNPVELKKTYLYDLKTEKGKEYIITTPSP
jgi:alpha-L-fucosidase 2